MLTADKIKKEVNKITPGYDIEKVFLFGSYATGEADDRSDVDIFIEYKKGFTLYELSCYQLELQDALHLPVDVVTSNAKKNGFALDKEIVLYEKK